MKLCVKHKLQSSWIYQRNFIDSLFPYSSMRMHRIPINLPYLPNTASLHDVVAWVWVKRIWIIIIMYFVCLRWLNRRTHNFICGCLRSSLWLSLCTNTRFTSPSDPEINANRKYVLCKLKSIWFGECVLWFWYSMVYAANVLRHYWSSNAIIFNFKQVLLFVFHFNLSKLIQ